MSHWKDQLGSGTGVRGGSKIYIACDKLEEFLTEFTNFHCDCNFLSNVM